MKEIYFLRHATASWTSQTTFDMDKPINKYGVHEAQLIENFASKNNISIDRVLCSPARRTKDTSDLIFPGFKYDIDSVIYKDFIYNGSSETLINLIETQDNFINSLLIIGHNPMLPKVISLLTNTPMAMYEPCTLTLINSKAWSSIHDSKLKFKVTPRQSIK